MPQPRHGVSTPAPHSCILCPLEHVTSILTFVTFDGKMAVPPPVSQKVREESGKEETGLPETRRSHLHSDCSACHEAPSLVLPTCKGPGEMRSFPDALLPPVKWSSVDEEEDGNVCLAGKQQCLPHASRETRALLAPDLLSVPSCTQQNTHGRPPLSRPVF